MKGIFTIVFCSLCFFVSSQQPVFTWVSGSDTVNKSGSYGTKGVASTTNAPGARAYSISWTHNDGSLWLFGGYASGLNMGNDLWKFDPSDSKWTWVSGSNIGNQTTVNGTLGVGATTNIPGARRDAVSWKDKNGDFYLYGGYGYDAFAVAGLNDMWKYTPGNNKWTWVSGNFYGNDFSNYGIKKYDSITNKPGFRYAATSWTDKYGNFWMFGGYGPYSSNGGFLSDVWKYNPTTNIWTWMSGPKTAYQGPVYGVLGISDSLNTPGYRNGCYTWIDNNDDLWLFGGRTSTVFYNDVWKYNMLTNEWTWMGGTTSFTHNGTYGTMGVASSSNIPGCRNYGTSWTDNEGKFWLYSGYSYGPPGGGYSKDLWKFEYYFNAWSWVACADLSTPTGIYGVKGIGSTQNIPGEREGGLAWKDNAGNFWLFGGMGAGAQLGTGMLNDLWKIDAASLISVKEISKNDQDQLELFPNPSNGQFSISSGSEKNIIITDLLGRIVLKVKLNSENNYTLHSNKMEPGTYIVIAADNYHTTSQKLIITN